jgi:CHRD domain-containing protein
MPIADSQMELSPTTGNRQLAIGNWQLAMLLTGDIMRPPHLATTESLEVKGMRRLGTSLAVIVLVSACSIAFAQGFKKISELLTGYEETPSAVSTTGNGTFNARISNDESQIDWELSYADLEGAVQQAHIHFGQKSVTGPISVFLCTNLGNGPAGTQACPAPPATVSGTITAADVTNIANERGISAGEFAELIKAIRAGATYVNVHSTRWPLGEIRSQINGNSGDEHH